VAQAEGCRTLAVADCRRKLVVADCHMPVGHAAEWAELLDNIPGAPWLGQELRLLHGGMELHTKLSGRTLAGHCSSLACWQRREIPAVEERHSNRASRQWFQRSGRDEE
jgi:hypothetical protein